MQCPVCHGDSKVVDSRTTDDGTAVKRRRECLACGMRFTTFEKIENMPLVVVKKSGRTELFDRTKILKGMAKACEKRPIQLEQLDKVADDIEKTLKRKYSKVPSSIIGETIMDALIALDEVAYVRFASVYKEFNNVNTFIKEIEHLQNKQ